MTPFLQKQETIFRRVIPGEKRVAIGIWRLGTGNSYRTIAKTFGVGKSTAVTISYDFCSALVRIFDRFISFPIAFAIEFFKNDVNCKIPQAFCAVDGTLIEIVGPNNDLKVDYFARNKRHAVNTQGIVGGNLLFLHLATWFPRSCHDARMWRAMQLYEKLAMAEILQYPEKIIENIRIKLIILCDGACPLRANLIKLYPYTNRVFREEIQFNKKLSAARVTVERAFDGLKARWRTLLKRLNSDITNVSDRIIMCSFA